MTGIRIEFVKIFEFGGKKRFVSIFTQKKSLNIGGLKIYLIVRLNLALNLFETNSMNFLIEEIP